MTTYTFAPVTIKARKSGKCPKCGKTYYRTVTFWETVNPWNRNPDGSICTVDDIYEKLCVQRDEWLKEPIKPHNCKEKLEPAPSNTIELDEWENMVNLFNNKFKKINELKSQIADLKNELKDEFKIFVDKTFDNGTYDSKTNSYKARETKISEIYSIDTDTNEMYFKIFGRDKTTKQFTYSYNDSNVKSLEDMLRNQIILYCQNNNMKKLFCYVDVFNMIFEKEDKTEEDIKCLKMLELYFKLNKPIYNIEYYKRQQECLKKLYDSMENQ